MRGKWEEGKEGGEHGRYVLMLGMCCAERAENGGEEGERRETGCLESFPLPPFNISECAVFLSH